MKTISDELHKAINAIERCSEWLPDYELNSLFEVLYCHVELVELTDKEKLDLLKRIKELDNLINVRNSK